jgi:bifunctional DNA-binding transcriptional regulator/antitoxin component of YhaV-PrlF toxin-antitoxin module
MGIAPTSGGSVLSVRRVDGEGRISLPRDWRSKSLRGEKEVVVLEQDDALVIRPRRKIDITRYFDSVQVDVDPAVFEDYGLLKHALLKQGKKRKG